MGSETNSSVVPVSDADEQSGKPEEKKKHSVLGRIQNAIRWSLHLIFSWSVPGFTKKGWNIWRQTVQMLLSATVLLLNNGCTLRS